MHALLHKINDVLDCLQSIFSLKIGPVFLKRECSQKMAVKQEGARVRHSWPTVAIRIFKSAKSKTNEGLHCMAWKWQFVNSDFYTSQLKCVSRLGENISRVVSENNLTC